jgi:hypothetical protein
MRAALPKARHLLLAGGLLLLATLIPGWFYWNKVGAHLARCVYGDASCSLTVSTYLLCAITSAAFLAAYAAALYAKRALEHEQTATLAVQGCRGCGKPQGIIHRYMDEDVAGFVEESRPLFDPREYGRADFDLWSVGRSPVVDCSLGVLVTNNFGDKYRTKVYVGSLNVGGQAHLVLWVSRAIIDSVRLEWTKEGVHAGVDRLELHERPHRITATIRMEFEPRRADARRIREEAASIDPPKRPEEQ